MDIRSLEYQMDAFYALLSPIHIQIESEIYEPGQLYVPEMKNISMNISAMLDGFQHCSQLLNELRKEEQKLTGMCIDIAKEMDSSEVVPGMRVDNKPVKIATDGTTGEQYLTLQD
jgi:hypothetical protein